MYYVYVLQSQKDKTFYLGCTKDLKRRILQHNNKQGLSTKSLAPWDLVYYEAYTSLKLAMNRENKLKHHGKGFAELKKRILEN
jgi:putative endonuclease